MGVMAIVMVIGFLGLVQHPMKQGHDHTEVKEEAVQSDNKECGDCPAVPGEKADGENSGMSMI